MYTPYSSGKEVDEFFLFEDEVVFKGKIQSCCLY